MSRIRKGLAVLSVSVLVCSHFMAYEAPKTFSVQGKNALLLSIETYKASDDGWKPVFLLVGDLEILLFMDADGTIKERKDLRLHPTPSLFAVDTFTTELIIGDSRVQMEQFGQSKIRTRLRPLNADLSLGFQLDPEKGSLTLIIGKDRIRFERLKAELVEITPGYLELSFRGSTINPTTRFVFDERTGTVYALDRTGDATPPDLSRARIWAKTAESNKGETQ